MMVSLALYNQIDTDKFLAAVDYYSKLFPNHPSLNIYQISTALARGDYDRAETALRALDKSVGGDVFLQKEMAVIYEAKGDLAAAKKAYQASMASPQAKADGYWGLIDLSLQEKQYAEAVRLLKEVEAYLDWDLDLDELAKTDYYAELSKTEAYAKWRQEKQAAEETP